MPDLESHKFNPSIARTEIQELRELLQSSDDIGEKRFRNFFEPRKHLRALVGRYNPELWTPDLLAWEYPIFNAFRCDFAVGDWTRKAYTFVEYEDATPTSLLTRQGDKAVRTWGRRLEEGFSQIVDWFYKLDTMTDTPDLEARFGKRAVRYVGVLIIGRDQHMDAGERMRLEWRRDYIVVNSRYVICVTYDQLLSDLLFQLDKLSPTDTSGEQVRRPQKLNVCESGSGRLEG